LFFEYTGLIKCHDCSKYICSDCREAHLREASNSISSLVSQLRRTLPKLSDKISSYEQRVNSVKTNHEQIQREITSAIATLIEELKHRETALFTEAEVYMQSQLRYIKSIDYILFLINLYLEYFVYNKKRLKWN
jgi:hypothetical protein